MSSDVSGTMHKRPLFRSMLSRHVVGATLVGFVLIWVLIWVDELVDMYFLGLGINARALHLIETGVETALIAGLAVLMTAYLRSFVRRITYLEGLLPVCASCKNIRVGDTWIPIETYISERSDALFSHGLCPECVKRLYGERFTHA